MCLQIKEGEAGQEDAAAASSPECASPGPFLPVTTIFHSYIHWMITNTGTRVAKITTDTMNDHSHHHSHDNHDITTTATILIQILGRLCKRAAHCHHHHRLHHHHHHHHQVMRTSSVLPSAPQRTDSGNSLLPAPKEVSIHKTIIRLR